MARTVKSDRAGAGPPSAGRPLQVRVAGAGCCVPPPGEGNAEIEQRLGLEPGWIQKRTGILSRPIAGPEMAASDLAVEAGRRALECAGIAAEPIGLLLLATSTPDHLLPPTAPLAAHRLGLVGAGAIDLAGACSGFVYALALAGAYAQAMRRPVLAIASNVLSRRVTPRDAATVPLFADGAGAVVLAPDEEPHLLGIYLGADGSKYESIRIPGGGSRQPLTAEALQEGRQYIVMERGAALFREACRQMAEAGRRAMTAAGAQQIDWWIPHQANLRLIRETGLLLGIPMERTIVSADRNANSSAATIPIALAEAAAGRIRRGELLLLTAVGAGMTSAGAVLRW